MSPVSSLPDNSLSHIGPFQRSPRDGLVNPQNGHEMGMGIDPDFTVSRTESLLS